MNTADFQNELVTTGSYETPEDLRISLLNRILKRSDAWVYTKIIGNLCDANFLTRIGKFHMKAWARQAGMMRRTFEFSGAKIRIEGFQHVMDVKGPRIYVANHMSLLETFIFAEFCAIPSEVSVVLKQSLMNYPLIGRVLHSTRAIVVTRTNPREDLKTVLSEGEKLLREGRSVMVFPQATRTHWFEPSRFNSIGVKLAKTAGVPIVPLALKTDFLRVGKRIRDFGSFPVRAFAIIDH